MASSALTLAESKSLSDHEGRIERGLHTFREVGTSLMAIRDQRLYRAEFKTFEAYCDKRWNLARNRAYQLIEAADAASDVQNFGHKPSKESQAAALAAAPKESRAEVWQEAVATAPKAKDGTPKITAKHVKETMQNYFNDEDDDPSDEIGCDEMFDHLDQPVPEHARDAFLDEEFIDQAIGHVKAATKAAQHVADSKAGGFLNIKQFRSLMRDAQKLLNATRPYAICPYCEGRKCSACAHVGVVPKEVLDQAQ